MTTINTLIELYLRHGEACGYSHHTQRNLRAHLQQFLRFLNEQQTLDVEMISESVIADYQRWLHRLPTQRGGPRRTTTLNRGLSAVRGLFRFGHEGGYLSRNPTRLLVLAREPRPLPQRILSIEEAIAVIEAIPSSTITALRDRAILEVLYVTGIRKSELIHLSVNDVDLENELLSIRGGKGGHDRVVPLARLASRCLAHYIKSVRPQLCKDHSIEHLFLSHRKQLLGATTVATLVQQRAAGAGVRPHMNCHLWRHTCATHMVQNGVNLRHLQELLGHQQLETTQRYLYLTINDLRKAHHRFHPREIEVARRRMSAHNQTHAANTGSGTGTPAEG